MTHNQCTDQLTTCQNTNIPVLSQLRAKLMILSSDHQFFIAKYIDLWKKMCYTPLLTRHL